MPKILIIVTKGELGGAQMSVLNLAKKLKEYGQDVNVGFGDGDFLKNELIKSAIPFYQFKYLRRTHDPFANLLFVHEMQNFLDKNDFQIVHFNSSNSLFGAIGAKLGKKKIKTVFTLRGMSLLDKNYQTNPILKFLYFWLFKFLLSFVDAKIFVCQHNYEFAKSINLLKNGVVIYNGLSTDELQFLPSDESKKFFIQTAKLDLPDKFIIGSIGRLDYAKNYEFLINNFAKILEAKNNAVLFIVGGGQEKSIYQRLIDSYDLNDKIFLLDEIKNAYQYINGFDLFTLPSRYEGLSITLIEALSSAVPILASDVGGNSELLADERELFQLNNINDFISKFKAIIDNTDAKAKLTEHNHQQSKIFDIDNTAKKYLAIYQD
jgi:glycosyltransferase involved in cell wall biosynthesis